MYQIPFFCQRPEIVSTGVRGIIRDMLKNNMFQCVITTCGALDHDIARTYEKYFAGEFEIDDKLFISIKYTVWVMS